jgi:ATPase subunit of ABC transporter with duplicated ATPase domains
MMMYSGTVRPLAGIKVGYLPQEPELDETKNVKENVLDGVADKRKIVERFKEVCSICDSNLAAPVANIRLLCQLNDIIASGKTLTQEEQLEHARHKARVEGENLNDLERKIEVAMIALRCPPSDAEVDVLSGVRFERFNTRNSHLTELF